MPHTARPTLRQIVLVHSLLLLAPLVSGCSGSSNDSPPFLPVTQPTQRMQGLGVSILPPPGDGWYVARQDTGKTWKVMFGESPTPDDAGKKIRLTTAVAVDVERIDRAALDKQFPTDRAALEHVRTQFDAPSSGRFRDISSNTTWTTLGGAECLRYTSIVEERNNPADPAAILTIRSQHVCCFHPQDRNIALWLMITQRYPQSTPAPPIEPLTDGIMRNLRFEPVK